MQDTLARWLNDPTVAKLTASLIAIIVVGVLVRLTLESLRRSRMRRRIRSAPATA